MLATNKDAVRKKRLARLQKRGQRKKRGGPAKNSRGEWDKKGN